MTAPNLKDVARTAGVSVTTISRFLNGSLALPDRTRTAVEDAIRALNENGGAKVGHGSGGIVLLRAA